MNRSVGASPRTGSVPSRATALPDAKARVHLPHEAPGDDPGHDTDDSPRRRYTLHPIASGAVTPRLLAGGLVVLGVVSVAVAAYFIALRGWPAVWLTLIGAVLLYAYDAAPRARRRVAMWRCASTST